MADITRLARMIGGMPRDVDMTTNSLQVLSLKVGALTPAELTKAMVTLLDTINTTGIPAANVSAGAKQAVLESKLAAMRVGVINHTPTTGNTSDTVTTPVLAAATTDTAIGAGAGIASASAKGIFVGTVSGMADIGKVLIRINGTDNGFDDGTGDEVYGVLSESGGVYTLSYKTAAGTAYTITASDTSAKMDFYFIEVMDLYSFGVDRLLMPAISGVIDATTASAVYGEGSARANADSSLQANIDAEISARILGDDTEITARRNADSSLQSNIDSEASSRTAADSSLQANLNSEITSRLNGDSTLTANLNSEITSRLNADSTLTANLDSEITSRLNGDSTLTANLDSEITSRLNGDSTLTANLDSEITSRENADSTLQANINDLGSADSSLQANIDAEVTARMEGDSSLQSNIDSEATSRENADSTLQANLDSEITSRMDGDSTLTANLDSEITSRMDGDSTLTANLDSEITSRLNGDSTLTANLDSEITSRENSDSTLTANLDSEITSRENSDSTLQANIDAEVTARMNEDSTLQALIDAINVSVVDVTYVAATGGIAAGDIVALSTTVAGEVIKANATAIATCESVLGVSTETKTAGQDVIIRAFGEATTTTDGTNFEVGKRVYVATTAGQGTKTAPAAVNNVVYLVGGATDTTKVFVNTNLEYVVQ